jgi:hypothetical protein
MPTGYTAAIKDGITFQEFALGCARAFGACISMRDDPSDTPIPDKFEPSNYHAEALKVANARLAELEAMSISEANEAALKEYLDGCERNIVLRQENAALRIKYQTMLDAAKKWVPPTIEHQGMKEFMIQQITDSIEWDCSDRYLIDPPRQTGEQWLANNILTISQNIHRHTAEQELEVDRARKRTEWVSALRNSLAE